jgi:hypothetical protein
MFDCRLVRCCGAKFWQPRRHQEVAALFRLEGFVGIVGVDAADDVGVVAPKKQAQANAGLKDAADKGTFAGDGIGCKEGAVAFRQGQQGGGEKCS